ncbi:hypothetical protein MKX01_028166 [Papaver californicum]|nr:hypothetical protein MKX01_028166 [Papaver californicum]
MKEMNTEIACIRLGNVHVIPVTSPELAREFLKIQDAIFAYRPKTMATEYLSRGYLTAIVTPWGDQWKKMRRVVTSEMVSHARLKWLLEKRNEEADNLVFYLNSQCNKNSLSGGEVINVRLVTRQLSGNVIRKMIFNKRYFGKGRNDGGPGIEEIEHVNSAFEVLYYIYAFGIQDYLPYLRWLDLDGHEKVIKRAMGFWISIMIQLLKKGFNNGAMINQSDILKKAAAEIDMVVDKSRWVQESDIPKLNYVKACAREALRLHRIAPFNVPHVSNSDAVFNPECHFMSKDVGIADMDLAEQELQFISFSNGRRGCVGGRLGTAITTMLLAILIQGFDWSAPPGESMIDLSESAMDLFLAKPLFAHAKPRLPLSGNVIKLWWVLIYALELPFDSLTKKFLFFFFQYIKQISFVSE